MEHHALLLCFFGLCSTVLVSVSGAGWSYGGSDGPNFWAQSYPACAGTSQSPIDILPEAAYADDDLGAFILENYRTTAGASPTLKNNGHSAVLYFNGVTMKLSGGGLPAKYTLLQSHFHWGSDNFVGSEHTVNSKSFPLEMHMVHYDASYGEVTDAIDKPKGLAVLGFFFEISTRDNADLAEVISALSGIEYPDNVTDVTVFPLETLFSGALGNFYRYDGSLTTPGCQETVVWSVHEKTIPISSRQLAAFRTLQDTHGGAIVDVFRPTQQQGTRVLTYSGTIDGAASITSSAVLMAAAFLAVLFH